MDGITLVGKVRESDKKTPMFMVTTEAEKTRVIEAIKAGVNNYVVKPFTPEGLLEKVNQTLSSWAFQPPACWHGRRGALCSLLGLAMEIMPPSVTRMDYEPGKSQRRSSVGLRTAIVVALIAGAPAAYFGVRICQQLASERRQIEQFEQKTSEAKLLGKTDNQIIAALGQPADQEDFSDGGRDLIYCRPYDVVCRFEIRGGVATNVVRWSK